MNLGINQLLQWCDEGAHIERVLWIERTGQRLVTIDVEDKQAWPSYVDRPTLEHRIAIGDIHLLDEDMYGYLRQEDEVFTISHLEQRDEAWKVIEDIVAPQEIEGIEGPGDGAFFNSSILGPLVQASMEKTGCSKQLVHTYLRRYWQRGQMKNALLPEFDHHDTPVKERNQYWYRMGRDLAGVVATRNNSHAFDTGERAVLGHLRQRIFGPGCQYEIHVVIGDMLLVSMLDRRRILGRPVIYIIGDVFSDLIVGMSVSLEGPNRQGAMLTLENMAHDKVAYCREFGIDITEDAWPSHHLPKAMLASRSELLLKNANILVNALDIEISNTQPCRLDWKESFERCFPLLDDMTIDWVPGSVNSLSKPGRKGHRLDGCLTLNEFRRLVIECIIEHNIAHRLSDDDLDEDMIADGVEPYPRDVWTWGIQNRTGVLRTLPIDDVRHSLLLEAEATVTHEGICFHTMHYTCGSAIQERWFEQVRTEMTGRFTIPVLYDPRTPDQIYLRPLGSQRLEICRLLEKDKAKFEGCDWFDIEDMIARRTIRTATDMRDS